MRTSHWFLVIALVVVAYVIFRGGDERFGSSSQQLNYQVVAVSNTGLSDEAQALNLEKDLDVALLPEIGKQSIREAAQKGLKEQAFLEDMLHSVSNRVREISTIDLNGDGTADPVLVKPEPTENEQFVLLSLRVPDPKAYPLPSASDTQAWQNLETFEVATMTVALNDKELTVQAQGNQHVYPNSANQNYVVHDRNPSFLQTYLTIRMVEWMFFPRMYGFYGPGYGYGGYRPVATSAVGSRRAGTVSSRGYSRAGASGTSAVRSRTGQAPRSAYSRAYSKTPPRALNQLRTSRSFARRQGAASTGGGGFGRSTQGSRSVAGGAASGGSRRYSNQRSTSRGFGGFGRGSSRGFFGGGGGRFGK